MIDSDSLQKYEEYIANVNKTRRRLFFKALAIKLHCGFNASILRRLFTDAAKNPFVEI